MSGSPLSTQISTFMVEEFQSKVALGPTTLAQDFTQKLRDEILQKTNLKEAAYKEDIKFYGAITEFKYKSIAPRSNSAGEESSSRRQLSITVEVTYKNSYNKSFEFSKKKFTQTTDIDDTASTDTEEPSMVEEVFKKLTQDIFNASIAIW